MPDALLNSSVEVRMLLLYERFIYQQLLSPSLWTSIMLVLLTRNVYVQRVLSRISCHTVYDIYTMFDTLQGLEVALRSQVYS